MEDKDLKTLPKLKNKHNFRHWQDSVLSYLGGKKLSYQLKYPSVEAVLLMTEEEHAVALVNMHTARSNDADVPRIVHTYGQNLPVAKQGLVSCIPLDKQEELFEEELFLNGFCETISLTVISGPNYPTLTNRDRIVTGTRLMIDNHTFCHLLPGFSFYCGIDWIL